jgi:hypothetical protein
LVLVALVALAANESSLFADEPVKPGLVVEPPLFGDEFSPQRGVATFLAAGFGKAGPLRQATLVTAGTHLHLWDDARPLLQGEDLAPAAAGLVLLCGTAPAPLGPLPFLKAGEQVGAWSLPVNAHVRSLGWHLAAVRDGTRLPLSGGQDVDSLHEALALNDALLKSLRTPVWTLQRAARTEVTIDDLEKTSTRCRGMIVQLEGRARRVRVLDAPKPLQPYGIKFLYQTWLVHQDGGVPRVVCLLSAVPLRGVEVKDKPGQEPAVAAVGYFFKQFRFKGSEGLSGYGESAVPLLVGYAIPLIRLQVRQGAGATAVTLAGFPTSGGPFQQSALLAAGERAGYWVLRDPSHVPPLDHKYFHAVHDRRPLPTAVEDSEAQTQEAFVYYEAVRKANETSADLFLKDARPEVTFAHVFQEPSRYRGEVVAIKGHLRRVRRFEPMEMVKSKDLKDLYECWLYNDEYGVGNPVCVICTKLPPGIKVTETVKGDVRVTFAGYFFKLFRYKAPDTKKPSEFRLAPLLIGTIVPEPPQKQTTQTAWTGGLLPLIVGVLMVSLALVLGLGWAFRRADQRVRLRVHAAAEQLHRPPEG